MKWGALVGWGIVIYSVVFLSWYGLFIHGYTSGILPHIVQNLVLIIVAVIAGRSLRFRSWKDILPYSFAWALMMGLLDIVYSVPFGGWQIYYDWNLWVGYAFVLLLPLLAPLTRYSRTELPEIT